MHILHISPQGRSRPPSLFCLELKLPPPLEEKAISILSYGFRFELESFLTNRKLLSLAVSTRDLDLALELSPRHLEGLPHMAETLVKRFNPEKACRDFTPQELYLKGEVESFLKTLPPSPLTKQMEGA